MRDTIKNEDYFKRYLEYEFGRIEKFEKAVNKVIEERGVRDRGVQSGLRTIEGFYFNAFIALYSSGASIESIKKFFPKVIHSMKPVWNSNRGYVEMIWMVSIGIMLGVPKIEMSELERMIPDDGIKDCLIDFLFSYYNKDWENNTEDFKFEIPYKSLSGVINAPNKEEALLNLKNYLTKEWYQGHKDTGWYNNHKSSEDIYNGYWSFESGAIAKILELDDHILKDIPYYPYDMVHYLED